MVKALAFEIRRLGMGPVDLDFAMKNDYAHPTSQKQGDIAVTSDGHLELTNATSMDHYPSPDLIIDVKSLCYGYCRWGLEGPMEC